MTGPQYKRALHRLGMNQGEAADFLKISLRTSASYAAGETIPEGVAMLLRLMIRSNLKPEDVK